MRNLKRAAVTAAALALIGVGATVAPPTADAAAGRVSALLLCEHANYGGTCVTLTRSALGVPDSGSGYFIAPSTWGKNNTSSIKSLGTGGNYVTLYEQTWAGTWGSICYSGYLNVSYVGDRCNDDIGAIQLNTR